MASSNKKLTALLNRRIRIKKKMRPESGLARLCVFRSNKHIYAQLIDDLAGKVIGSAGTRSKAASAEGGSHNNIAAAKQIGATIAKQAQDLKITHVRFDRNGYRYHGRVKALADAAREAGLKF